jgi:hypothetical protein
MSKKGARSSGTGAGLARKKDSERAAYMKKAGPGRYPNSISRGFTGHGLESGVRAGLLRMMGKGG